MNGLKTYTGLIIAAIPTIASAFGFDTATGFSQEAAELVESAMTIIGLGIAFYGRLVAVVPGWFAKK